MEHWDQIYQQKRPLPWSRVDEELLKKFLRYKPEPKTALDIGCGEGYKSRWLAEKGFAVTGIDVSTVAIARAKAHNTKATYLVHNAANLDTLGIALRSIGLALDLISSQFISAEKQPGYFDAIAKVLSPTGIFTYTFLVATGPDSPEWVNHLGVTEKSLRQLTDDTFKTLGTEEKQSKNLPDTKRILKIFKLR